MTRTSPIRIGADSRRWSRWVAAGLAAATALSAALVAPPAGAASTPPQISVVTGYAGANSITLGHPKPAATASLSAGYVAYDPANGDEAVAVTAGTTANVYLIAGADEPNEYHIKTSATTYSTLVKGDAYLVAGNGKTGMIADPGGGTPETGGSTTPAATANPISPASVAFDPSGNLLIAGRFNTTGSTRSGIQMVAKTTCGSSCPYRYSSVGAGDLYSIAGSGSWHGITRTPAIVFTTQVQGFGMAVDSQGDIVDGAAGFVVFINEQAMAVTRYGQTVTAFSAAVIAGTGTHTGATCGGGSKNVNATGKTSPKFQWPHPYFGANGNVYVNSNKSTAGHGCTWVLPATSGALDGQFMTAGRLYTLTGAATTTPITNGAPANTTSFPNTNAVAVDPVGNVLLASSGTTPSLRVIAESTGTFYDQTMTKGDVYTIAGGSGATRVTPGNATGFKFDGAPIPATPPAFGITSLITGAKGDLLVTDGSSATSGTLYEITHGPTGSTITVPSISSLNPTSGFLAGGTTVTIHGNHFTGATAVDFGTVAGSTITVQHPTLLTVVDPAHPAGTVPVTVTTLGGTATRTTAFTYVTPKPMVASITPTTGTTAGGTIVTFRGSYFTGTTAVHFGTTASAHVIVTSPTTLTATAPAHTAGTVAVSVTTPGGTATKKTAFTYVAAMLPDAPTGVTAARGGSGTAIISWTASATHGSPITKYSVTSSPTAKSCTTTGALTCTISGLVNGLTYAFTVRAMSAAGTSVVSKPGHVVPATLPSAPGTPTAEPGVESVTVRWTAPTPTPGGISITKYTVSSTPTDKTCTATGTATKVCKVSGLRDGIAYKFKVNATNAVGTGPTSVSSNSAIPEPVLPGAPTNVAAVAGDAKAKVTWTPPATDGGSPITGYTVSSTPGGKTCTTTGALTCTVTGLTNGDSYSFSVYATNSVGAGPTSQSSPVVVPRSTATTPAPPTPINPKPKDGYWEVAADGGLFAFGAAFFGSEGGKPLNAPIVGMAATPTGKGYWEVAADGGLFAFGTAQFYGSEGGKPLNAPVVGMTATPTGKGYWEVAADGGLFAFGTAQFYGSEGGKPLNAPVVGMTATPTGKGYWEVAADGGLFAFGTAQFYGSEGGKPLNAPVVGMTATPTGKGYWEVAADGGLFAFGTAQFYGSEGGKPLNAPIVGMTATPTGKGYWEVAADGGLFAFGAPFNGSMGGKSLQAPIVGVAAIPPSRGT
jgi:hypothetical protein